MAIKRNDENKPSTPFPTLTRLLVPKAVPPVPERGPTQATPQDPPQLSQRTPVLKFHRAELYQKDLDACHRLSNTRLTYNLIHFYFQYLKHEVWKNHKDFGFVSPGETAGIEFERLNFDLGRRVSKARYTFFPIYVRQWRLFVYDNVEKYFSYYSSSSYETNLAQSKFSDNLIPPAVVLDYSTNWTIVPVLEQRGRCSGSHLLCNVDMLCYKYAMGADNCPLNDPRSYAAIEGKRLDLLKIITNLKGKFTNWTNFPERTPQIDVIPYKPSIPPPASYRQPRPPTPVSYFQPIQHESVPNRKPCLKYEGATLTQDDLDILRGKNWITDSIIHFYFNYLQIAVWPDEENAENKRFHFVDASITAIIKAGTHDDDIMKPIKEAQYTFVAVNNAIPEQFEGTHWSLLVFVRDTKRFYHFDSLKSNGPHAEMICKNIQAKLGEESEENSFSEVNCAKQKNSYDCGIFVLSNVDNLCYWIAQLGHQTIEGAPLVLPAAAAKKRSDIITLIIRFGGRLK